MDGLWMSFFMNKFSIYYAVAATVFFRKIHILGSFQNIKIARTAICNLILGNVFHTTI